MSSLFGKKQAQTNNNLDYNSKNCGRAEVETMSGSGVFFVYVEFEK
jgi:hypothetical protein